MAYLQGEYLIKSKQNLARNIYDIVVSCPEMAKEALPGQFVHIRVAGKSLRRPISICEIDREAGCLRLVFEVRGEGTEQMAQWRAGDSIDLIGPLGKGFTLLPAGKKAVLIGGGIGTPPMLALAKHYGADCTVITGFRTASAVILQEDFKAVGAKTVLCTDDGSVGEKGFVTGTLETLLMREKPDIICACGPHPMLRSVASLADEKGIHCEVSLEERMGCGVGACLVCACKVVKDSKEYFAHVCKDGPVFDAKEIVL